MRKIAAASGLANSTRNGCSRTSPARPTGIVATTISQASFWSADRISRWAMLVKNPRMTRTQALAYTPSRTIAVARCRPTTKAR